MTWNLQGQLYESCSCNMFCPCWFGVQELMIMDQGWCDGVLGFRLREGSSDGVALNGRDVLFAIHFPGPTLFDADATARLCVDEGADDDQQRELKAIFQGEKGGPMENIAALVSTWLPTQRARIGVTEDGDSVTITVEGAGDLRSRLLRDPEGTPFTLRGGGFVSGLGMEVAELAPSATQWADPEMPQSFETKSGARGSFAWSG
ncbi:DUF1326 domain-containing protein [Streptomyces sp. NPDC015127]|uniref:DUF1326 domain-containing protein n=1 Tax=Streptomyces sp. NPDC015127 TaxID=3364939 RepID=UPI0036F51251